MQHQIEIYLLSESALNDCLRISGAGVGRANPADRAVFCLHLSTLDEAGKLRVKSMPAHGALFTGESPLDRIGQVVVADLPDREAMHLSPDHAREVVQRFQKIAHTIVANKGHIAVEEKLIIHALELAVQQQLHTLVFSDFTFRGYE